MTPRGKTISTASWSVDRSLPYLDSEHPLLKATEVCEILNVSLPTLRRHYVDLGAARISERIYRFSSIWISDLAQKRSVEKFARDNHATTTRRRAFAAREDWWDSARQHIFMPRIEAMLATMYGIDDFEFVEQNEPVDRPTKSLVVIA